MLSRPEVIVGHMTRLFSEFGRIAPKYSLSPLNQGFWGIFGENLRLYELWWDSSIPWDQWIQCIRSMYSVYFQSTGDGELLRHVVDLILHGFWFQQKIFERRIQMGDVSKLDTESRHLLDVMFETLKQILGTDSGTSTTLLWAELCRSS